MVPYRYDPEHIAPATAPPRCQPMKVSGGRCGAPARRKRRYCRFHERRTKPKPKGVISLGYITDAASLQDVLVRARRMIHSPNTDPEARGLMVYALQIEAMSAKADPLMNCHPERRPNERKRSEASEGPVQGTHRLG